MMKSTRFGVIAVTVAALFLASAAVPSVARACAISQFALAEQEDLPPFTFVLFYDPGNEADDESLETLKKLNEKWEERANVVFEAIDVSTERGRRLAEYWQVKEYPVTYVLAPTNWALAVFEGKLDFDEAEKLMTSPGKQKLAEALAKHTVVFLVLGTEKTNRYEEILNAAKKAQEDVAKWMEIKSEIVIVDPTDEREAKLLQNLGLEGPPENAQVFVTYGDGLAVIEEVHREKVEDALAFTIQVLGTADQCSLGRHIFGEPLLMGK